MARTSHFKRTFHEICRNCHGTGKVAVPNGAKQIVITCPVCNGRGMVKKQRKVTSPLSRSLRNSSGRSLGMS